MADGNGFKALTFDVFGTVVDWRSSIAREAESILAPKGHTLDWPAFADRWRALYQPAMEEVRSGRRPFAILDDLHRENLVTLLGESGVAELGDPEIDHLNLAWHRLDPWPDVVEGLARLKRRFILATLSNGNVALMVDIARRAALPWDVILGAEIARAYKPAPEAYDGAARMLRLAPRQCLMVAAHPADLRAAAARGFATGRGPFLVAEIAVEFGDDGIELKGARMDRGRWALRVAAQLDPGGIDQAGAGDGQAPRIFEPAGLAADGDQLVDQRAGVDRAAAVQRRLQHPDAGDYFRLRGHEAGVAWRQIAGGDGGLGLRHAPAERLAVGFLSWPGQLRVFDRFLTGI
ncbi:MAG TPA: haloacid dehalogenase type II [Caulobacteraceae bacterium]|nr:haloacid dehalogenase type II [Caulobacteraceae bacterium]